MQVIREITYRIVVDLRETAQHTHCLMSQSQLHASWFDINVIDFEWIFKNGGFSVPFDILLSSCTVH